MHLLLVFLPHIIHGTKLEVLWEYLALCCACRNYYRDSVFCISLVRQRERKRQRGRARMKKRVRGRGSPVLLATTGCIWAVYRDRHALSLASFAA